MKGMQKYFETNILADFPKLEYHSPEIPKLEDDSETVIEVIPENQ